MIRFVSNLRLVHKLAIPAVLLLVSGLVTLLSAAHLHDVFEQQTLDVIDRDVVRLELANKVARDLLVGKVISRDVRLATDPGQIEALADQSRHLRSDIEDELDGLSRLMTDPEQRQAVVECNTAFVAFEAAINGTIVAKTESLRNGTAGPTGGKGRIERAKVDRLLDRIVAYSKADMRRTRDEAVATGQSATAVLVYASGVARIVALALLVWIAMAQIARPLVRMARLTKRLADGDLDVAIVGTERADEIGTLARSLLVFKHNAIKLQSAYAELAHAKDEAEGANRATQAANASLEFRVDARTAELRAAQDDLLRAERLTVLGRLTASVAHELRNPLSTLRNSLFSTRQLPAAQDASLDRPLSRMQKAVDRCERIIQELLDYARPREPIKVGAVFDTWLDDALREQSDLAGVKVAHDLGAGGAVVKFDHDRFRHVIVNLIENAVQAMTDPDRPPALRRIAVSTRVVADRLELVVADSGPGIPPDILPKVFEPLFSTKSFSTGLGLPSVKLIVEQNGGTVAIESEMGKGTLVRILLPCVMPLEMAAA